MNRVTKFRRLASCNVTANIVRSAASCGAAHRLTGPMIADIATRFAVDKDLVEAIRTTPQRDLLLGFRAFGLI